LSNTLVTGLVRGPTGFDAMCDVTRKWLGRRLAARVRESSARPKRRLTITVLTLVLTTAPTFTQAGAPQTLRLIAQADLRVLDPIWTTATITRNFGYMVYDTLFALDRQFRAQPQMVQSWIIAPDRQTYTFTLRDKLKFSDGEPVRSADCIASLKRWSARDALGQSLAAAIAQYRVEDDHTFAIVLKKPFPLLLYALAKPDSNVPFMMPQRIAETSPDVRTKDATGSGPFVFVRDEWQPGHQAVFVKNPEYVPRNEPPSWAAGGKSVRVDRVEWLYIPDPATAMAAFTAGEADWWEDPPPDFYPLLANDAKVSLAQSSPLDVAGLLRFNQLQPPFDKTKMRLALLYAVDQSEYMSAVAGDAHYWHTCYSIYACGGPMASDAGAEALERPRDLDRAKALIHEAGYHGEKVVLLDPTDFFVIHAMVQVTGDMLRRLGVNVEVQAMDWGTLLARRAVKSPVDQGGWSIFLTMFPGFAILDPGVDAPLRANGAEAWLGWPADPVIEKLRDAWLAAPAESERKILAADLQREAFKSIPYIPLGEFSQRTAFHTNLTGVDLGPGLFLWNVTKGGPLQSTPRSP
jgi:peptide/nickel transport system substrate-binding protein